MEYPYTPHVLQDQILKRKEPEQPYTEPELWYLLYHLVSAKIDLNEHGIEMGDLRPQNLLFTEEGLLLVPNMVTSPVEHTSFEKAVDQEPVYLAPEDLKKLEEGVHTDPKSSESEIFLIGLTMLSVGLLEDLTPLFNLKTYKLDEPAFNKLLTKWTNSAMYSEVLRGTVSSLCEHDPKARMEAKEVKGLLEKHEKHILEQQSFIINNAPQKLHKKIKALRDSQRVQ